MSTPLTAACEWRPGAVCQFPDLRQTVAQFDGRSLCRAHAPVTAPDKRYEWMRDYVQAQSRADMRDFSGCIFPAGPANTRAEYTFPASISERTRCNECRFEGEVMISGSRQELDLSNCYFAGKVYVTEFGGALTCINSKFEGDVGVSIVHYRAVVDLSRCCFVTGLSLSGLDKCSRLSLNRARFGAVPLLHEDRIPQQTTFTGATFLPETLVPENEGAYRRIRNQFAANRARELEGQFYRYEKVCHRRSLPWKSKWFARGLSYLYDLTAQYGQSYERAFLAFAIVQIAFGLGYSIASHRFAVPGHVDGAIAVFTLSQVVKPFELFSAKDALSPAYQVVVGNSPSAWWAFFSLAHSAVSITLVALFILALRWRFRRE